MTFTPYRSAAPTAKARFAVHGAPYELQSCDATCRAQMHARSWLFSLLVLSSACHSAAPSSDSTTPPAAVAPATSDSNPSSNTDSNPDAPLVKAGVVRVRDDFVSMFVIPSGEHAAILVDAGFDATAKALKTSLAQNRIELTDIKAVFLTHVHADHIAALALLSAAKIYSFAAADDLKALGIDPSRLVTLRDGEVINAAGTRVKAYAVPGHTSDGAAFVIHDVLFLGDAATQKASSASLQASPWIFSGETQQPDDEKKNVTALHHLHTRLKADGEAVRVLAMAHSDPLSDVDALAKAE